MGNFSNKGSHKPKKQKIKGTLKVLMLGIAGSGKSTFVKQIKIITEGGFPEEEVAIFKDILLKNIMIGMQELVKQAEKLEYQIEADHRKHARFFLELPVMETEWNKTVAKKARSLWHDKVIRQTWSAAPSYQLQMTQLDYLMDNLERFEKTEFIPTNEDILRARQRTTGQQITSFVTDKYRWDFVDVGGQKPERAKWSAILDEGSNTAIVWFMALDEYNMQSTEEVGKTKMQISFELFEEVMNDDRVNKLALILFLNKVDLFEVKLKDDKHRKDFETLFPGYDKDESGIEGACKLVIERAESSKKNPDTELHAHVTNALDTEMMRIVFGAVKENVFMNRLKYSGVLM